MVKNAVSVPELTGNTVTETDPTPEQVPVAVTLYVPDVFTTIELLPDEVDHVYVSLFTGAIRVAEVPGANVATVLRKERLPGIIVRTMKPDVNTPLTVPV